MNLNNLRNKAFATATAKGFHGTEYSNEHWLMLVITELSEAIEADRKDSHADVELYKILLENDEEEKEAGYSYIHYSNEIKGTVEEELADAVIRLLDLAGLRDVDVEISEDGVVKASKIFAGAIFTESIMVIAGVITDPRVRFDIKDDIICTLGTIFALAKHLDIDLLWHIEQKMKYNETRESLHGKAY